MRVWALASCSGLLALAACSAEQSTVPTPGDLPQDSDKGTQLEAETEGTPTTLSPTAAPELSPRPGLPSSVRQPASSPLSPAVAGRTSAQSTELRARLQRLRAQHSDRLSAGQVAPPSLRSSPLVRAPLVSSPLAAQPPAFLASATPAPTPAAQPAGLPEKTGVPETGPAAETAGPAGARTGVAEPGGATAVSAPSQLAAVPGPGAVGLAPGTATDLGPLAAARPDQRYPIAPRRHQGYSTRQSPAALVLMPQPEVAVALAAAPRLHGESPDGPVAAVLTPPAPAAPAPAPQAGPAPLRPPSEASATPDVSAPLPSPGQHQGDDSAPSLEVGSRSLGRSPALAGAVVQRPTAIPQPESLPLNPTAPSLQQGQPLPSEPRVEGTGRATSAAIAGPEATPEGHRSAAAPEILPLPPDQQGDWFNLPETAKSRFAPCPGPSRAPAPDRGAASVGMPVPGARESALELGLTKGPELCSADRVGDGPEALSGESVLGESGSGGVVPAEAPEALPAASVSAEPGE
jgi:hypothetical protein